MSLRVQRLEARLAAIRAELEREFPSVSRPEIEPTPSIVENQRARTRIDGRVPVSSCGRRASARPSRRSALAGGLDRGSFGALAVGPRLRPT